MDSIYCKICSSCGEDGCCSSLMCAYATMVENKPEGCSYGEAYFKELEISYKFTREVYEYIMDLPDMHIDAKIIKKKVEEIYDNIED